MRLHEVGTSSFILEVPTHRAAVKILKPYHLGNVNLERSTQKYAEDYHRLPHENVPAIRLSGPRFILMDFIPGETLEEFLARSIWGAKRPQWQDLSPVLTDICVLLGRCAELSPPVYHGDLSASNVLVVQRREGGEDRLQVFLLDFGLNYLLNERVGSDEEFQIWRARTAPEILALGPAAAPTLAADLYAFGNLLALCLLGGAFDPKALQVSVDEVYQRLPGFGGVLDDLLDVDEQARLRVLSEAATPYEALKEKLTAELALADIDAFARDSPLVNWTLTLLDVPVTGVKEVVREVRRRQARLQGALDAAARHYGLLTLTVNFIVVLAFIAKAGELLSHRDLQFAADVLPGYLTAITSSLVAAKGYLSIFSRVPFQSVSRFADVTASLYSWFFSVPILFALLVNPHAWPICGAAGVAVVALHNWSAGRMADMAERRMTAEGYRISNGMREVRRRLEGWWKITAAFAAGLLILGGLLITGVLHDEFAYAMIMVAANIKMYLYNASEDSGVVRGALIRFANGYRRAISRLAIAGQSQARTTAT